MISSGQSPSQNTCMHPTPGGDSPMPTTDRRSLLSFVAAFAQPGTGFCSPDLADFHDLYISSGEKLFNKILTCPNHILRTLLPPPTAQNYSLRNRPHNRQLPDRISRITDCNFTVRMLYRPYRNMYWLLYILDLCFVLFLCTTAVWQFAINEYVVDVVVVASYCLSVSNKSVFYQKWMDGSSWFLAWGLLST